MTFDFTKAFEADNGIILDSVNGVGLFSGNGSPVGTDAPQRSYYFNSADGLMWYKFGAGVNDWRKVRPEFFIDHIALFTSNGAGQSFNKNTYERLAFAHMEGLDELVNNSVVNFQVIASQSGTSSVDIRLWDVTNNALLAGPINFTENVPTLKQSSFTIPSTEINVEIQGKKNGNSVGTLFWSSVETNRTGL